MVYFVVAILFLGVGFVLLAAVGALRFPDSLTRMAAVSKASTLGITLILLAAMLQSSDPYEMVKMVLIIALLWFSAPISAHLLARSALMNREKLANKTKGIELVNEINSNN